VKNATGFCKLKKNPDSRKQFFFFWH